MPATSPRGSDFLRTELQDLRRLLGGLGLQQQLVFTDPRPAPNSGDPAHGSATVVLGNLLPITGLQGFGMAVYEPGVGWVEITGSGGVGGSAVLSVNGDIGSVVLAAPDVNAEQTGAAA